MSLLVFWFGLEGVLPDSRYLVFLLPRQSLEISVPQPQAADLNGAQISWIKTSLGGLSLNALDYQGWERVDDALVLVDPQDNRLTWAGQTGKEALIVFKTSPAGGMMKVSWNGAGEEIDLYSSKEDELIHRRQFQTPFYASRAIPLLFGIFNVLAGLFTASVLIWRALKDHKIEPDKVRTSMAGSAWQRVDLILMAGLVSAALLLRVFNLENLYPFADEYSHLLAAKNILNGMPLNQVYQRSLAIVTLPVVLFFKIFGTYIWTARLVTVIFNSLAVIPLYLITRRINRPVAVIAGLLFATSPWMIAVARNIREYGYYPFYFYWILYAMFLFLERVPDKFVLARDWKKVITPAGIGLLLLLAFPVYYSRYIDLSSTFRTVLPAYFVFSLFLLKKLDWKNTANAWLILVIFALIILGYKIFLNRLHISPNFFGNLNAFHGYFLKISTLQWFHQRPPILLGFVLGAALMMAVYLRKNSPYPVFFLVLFCASALLFIMNFNHDYRPRYYFHLEIWYIPLVALGVYGLWLALKLILISVFPRQAARQGILQNAAAVTAALALALTVNFRQALLPTFHKENGFMPITTEYHYDLRPVHEYMLAHASSEDVSDLHHLRQLRKMGGGAAIRAYFLLRLPA